jgi:hypothetical protein
MYIHQNNASGQRKYRNSQDWHNTGKGSGVNLKTETVEYQMGRSENCIFHKN